MAYKHHWFRAKLLLEGSLKRGQVIEFVADLHRLAKCKKHGNLKKKGPPALVEIKRIREITPLNRIAPQRTTRYIEPESADYTVMSQIKRKLDTELDQEIQSQIRDLYETDRDSAIQLMEAYGWRYYPETDCFIRKGSHDAVDSVWRDPELMKPHREARG